MTESQDKVEKLEKQNQSLKSRISNLQKMIESSEEKPTTETPKPDNNIQIKKVTSTNNVNFFEPFATSISWLNEKLLKQKINFNLPLNNDVDLLEKIHKILPSLADLLINSKKLFKENQKIFLEFIYWSLLHFDLGFQSQVSIKNKKYLSQKKIYIFLRKLMFRLHIEELAKNYTKVYN